MVIDTHEMKPILGISCTGTHENSCNTGFTFIQMKLLIPSSTLTRCKLFRAKQIYYLFHTSDAQIRCKSGCCRMLLLLAGCHHEHLTQSMFRLFPEWESVPKLPITFLNAMNQLTDDDLLSLTPAGFSQLLPFASPEIKTRVHDPYPLELLRASPAAGDSCFAQKHLFFSFHSERAHGLKTRMPQQGKLNIYFLLK